MRRAPQKPQPRVLLMNHMIFLMILDRLMMPPVTSCGHQFQVSDSASHVRVAEGLPGVAADVPVDDTMLEEDQPGALGGAPHAGYLMLETRALRIGEEIVPYVYGFSYRLLQGRHTAMHG